MAIGGFGRVGRRLLIAGVRSPTGAVRLSYAAQIGRATCALLNSLVVAVMLARKVERQALEAWRNAMRLAHVTWLLAATISSGLRLWVASLHRALESSTPP